jgi:hypothetical protein
MFVSSDFSGATSLAQITLKFTTIMPNYNLPNNNTKILDLLVKSSFLYYTTCNLQKQQHVSYKKATCNLHSNNLQLTKQLLVTDKNKNL